MACLHRQLSLFLNYKVSSHVLSSVLSLQFKKDRKLLERVLKIFKDDEGPGTSPL